MDSSSHPICPYCGTSTRRGRYGFCGGVQRYRCSACEHTYMEGDGRSYESETRARALASLREGNSQRAVAATMGIALSTLTRWRNAEKEQEHRGSLVTRMPPAPARVPMALKSVVAAPRPVVVASHPAALPSAPKSGRSAIEALEAGEEVSVTELMASG